MQGLQRIKVKPLPATLAVLHSSLPLPVFPCLTSIFSLNPYYFFVSFNYLIILNDIRLYCIVGQCCMSIYISCPDLYIWYSHLIDISSMETINLDDFSNHWKESLLGESFWREQERLNRIHQDRIETSKYILLPR